MFFLLGFFQITNYNGCLQALTPCDHRYIQGLAEHLIFPLL